MVELTQGNSWSLSWSTYSLRGWAKFHLRVLFFSSSLCLPSFPLGTRTRGAPGSSVPPFLPPAHAWTHHSYTCTHPSYTCTLCTLLHMYVHTPSLLHMYTSYTCTYAPSYTCTYTYHPSYMHIHHPPLLMTTHPPSLLCHAST